MTVEDIRNLEGHINKIAKQDNTIAAAMTHYDNPLSSFMSNTDKRFSNVMAAIENNYHIINNLAHKFGEQIKQYEQV